LTPKRFKPVDEQIARLKSERDHMNATDVPSSETKWNGWMVWAGWVVSMGRLVLSEAEGHPAGVFSSLSQLFVNPNPAVFQAGVRDLLSPL
jgi:hypothetical protein